MPVPLILVMVGVLVFLCFSPKVIGAAYRWKRWRG